MEKPGRVRKISRNRGKSEEVTVPSRRRKTTVATPSLTKVTSLLGRNRNQVDFLLDSSNAVASQYISRLHARIVRQDNNSHRLFDDSLNGIFINNTKMQGSVVLREGDVVTFGHPFGVRLAAGVWKRQPDSEYQFIFEKCCCPLQDSDSNTDKSAQSLVMVKDIGSGSDSCQCGKENFIKDLGGKQPNIEDDMINENIMSSSMHDTFVSNVSLLEKSFDKDGKDTESYPFSLIQPLHQRQCITNKISSASPVTMPPNISTASLPQSSSPAKQCAQKTILQEKSKLIDNVDVVLRDKTILTSCLEKFEDASGQSQVDKTNSLSTINKGNVGNDVLGFSDFDDSEPGFCLNDIAGESVMRSVLKICQEPLCGPSNGNDKEMLGAKSQNSERGTQKNISHFQAEPVNTKNQGAQFNHNFSSVPSAFLEAEDGISSTKCLNEKVSSNDEEYVEPISATPDDNVFLVPQVPAVNKCRNTPLNLKEEQHFSSRKLPDNSLLHLIEAPAKDNGLKGDLASTAFEHSSDTSTSSKYPMLLTSLTNETRIIGFAPVTTNLLFSAHEEHSNNNKTIEIKDAKLSTCEVDKSESDELIKSELFSLEMADKQNLKSSCNDANKPPTSEPVLRENVKDVIVNSALKNLKHTEAQPLDESGDVNSSKYSERPLNEEKEEDMALHSSESGDVEDVGKSIKNSKELVDKTLSSKCNNPICSVELASEPKDIILTSFAQFPECEKRLEDGTLKASCSPSDASALYSDAAIKQPSVIMSKGGTLNTIVNPLGNLTTSMNDMTNISVHSRQSAPMYHSGALLKTKLYSPGLNTITHSMDISSAPVDDILNKAVNSADYVSESVSKHLNKNLNSSEQTNISIGDEPNTNIQSIKSSQMRMDSAINTNIQSLEMDNLLDIDVMSLEHDPVFSENESPNNFSAQIDTGKSSINVSKEQNCVENEVIFVDEVNADMGSTDPEVIIIDDASDVEADAILVDDASDVDSIEVSSTGRTCNVTDGPLEFKMGNTDHNKDLKGLSNEKWISVANPAPKNEKATPQDIQTLLKDEPNQISAKGAKLQSKVEESFVDRALSKSKVPEDFETLPKTEPNENGISLENETFSENEPYENSISVGSQICPEIELRELEDEMSADNEALPEEDKSQKDEVLAGNQKHPKENGMKEEEIMSAQKVPKENEMSTGSQILPEENEMPTCDQMLEEKNMPIESLILPKESEKPIEHQFFPQLIEMPVVENKNLPEEDKMPVKNQTFSEEGERPIEKQMHLEETDVFKENKKLSAEDKLPEQGQNLPEEDEMPKENKTDLGGTESMSIENKNFHEKDMMVVKNQNQKIPEENEMPLKNESHFQGAEISKKNKQLHEEDNMPVRNQNLPKENEMFVGNQIPPQENDMAVEKFPEEYRISVKNQKLSEEVELPVKSQTLPQETEMSIDHNLFPKEHGRLTEKHMILKEIDMFVDNQELHAKYQEIPVEKQNSTEEDPEILEEKEKLAIRHQFIPVKNQDLPEKHQVIPLENPNLPGKNEVPLETRTFPQKTEMSIDYKNHCEEYKIPTGNQTYPTEDGLSFENQMLPEEHWMPAEKQELPEEFMEIPAETQEPSEDHQVMPEELSKKHKTMPVENRKLSEDDEMFVETSNLLRECERPIETQTLHKETKMIVINEQMPEEEKMLEENQKLPKADEMPIDNQTLTKKNQIFADNDMFPKENGMPLENKKILKKIDLSVRHQEVLEEHQIMYIKDPEIPEDQQVSPLEKQELPKEGQVMPKDNQKLPEKHQDTIVESEKLSKDGEMFVEIHPPEKSEMYVEDPKHSEEDEIPVEHQTNPQENELSVDNKKFPQEQEMPEENKNLEENDKSLDNEELPKEIQVIYVETQEPPEKHKEVPVENQKLLKAHQEIHVPIENQKLLEDEEVLVENQMLLEENEMHLPVTNQTSKVKVLEGILENKRSEEEMTLSCIEERNFGLKQTQKQDMFSPQERSHTLASDETNSKQTVSMADIDPCVTHEENINVAHILHTIEKNKFSMQVQPLYHSNKIYEAESYEQQRRGLTNYDNIGADHPDDVLNCPISVSKGDLDGTDFITSTPVENTLNSNLKSGLFRGENYLSPVSEMSDEIFSHNYMNLEEFNTEDKSSNPKDTHEDRLIQIAEERGACHLIIQSTGIEAEDFMTIAENSCETKNVNKIGNNEMQDSSEIFEKEKQDLKEICEDETLDINEICEDADETQDLKEFCKDDAQDVNEVCGDKIQDLKEICEDETQDLNDICEDETQDTNEICEDDIQDLNEICEDETKDTNEICEDETQDLNEVCEDETNDTTEICEDETLDFRKICEEKTKDTDEICKDETQDLKEICEVETQDWKEICEDEMQDFRKICEEKTQDTNEICKDETQDLKEICEVETQDWKEICEIETEDTNERCENETQDFREICEEKTQDTNEICKDEIQDLKEIREDEIQDINEVCGDKTQDLKEICEDETKDTNEICEDETQDLKEICEEETQDTNDICVEETQNLNEICEDKTKDANEICEEETQDWKEFCEDKTQDWKEISEDQTHDLKEIGEDETQNWKEICGNEMQDMKENTDGEMLEMKAVSRDKQEIKEIAEDGNPEDGKAHMILSEIKQIHESKRDFSNPEDVAMISNIIVDVNFHSSMIYNENKNYNYNRSISEITDRNDFCEKEVTPSGIKKFTEEKNIEIVMNGNHESSAHKFLVEETDINRTDKIMGDNYSGQSDEEGIEKICDNKPNINITEREDCHAEWECEEDAEISQQKFRGTYSKNIPQSKQVGWIVPDIYQPQILKASDKSTKEAEMEVNTVSKNFHQIDVCSKTSMLSDDLFVHPDQPVSRASIPSQFQPSAKNEEGHQEKMSDEATLSNEEIDPLQDDKKLTSSSSDLSSEIEFKDEEDLHLYWSQASSNDVSTESDSQKTGNSQSHVAFGSQVLNDIGKSCDEVPYEISNPKENSESVTCEQTSISYQEINPNAGEPSGGSCLNPAPYVDIYAHLKQVADAVVLKVERYEGRHFDNDVFMSKQEKTNRENLSLSEKLNLSEPSIEQRTDVPLIYQNFDDNVLVSGQETKIDIPAADQIQNGTLTPKQETESIASSATQENKICSIINQDPDLSNDTPTSEKKGVVNVIIDQNTHLQSQEHRTDIDHKSPSSKLEKDLNEQENFIDQENSLNEDVPIQHQELEFDKDYAGVQGKGKIPVTPTNVTYMEVRQTNINLSPQEKETASSSVDAIKTFTSLDFDGQSLEAGTRCDSMLSKEKPDQNQVLIPDTSSRDDISRTEKEACSIEEVSKNEEEGLGCPVSEVIKGTDLEPIRPNTCAENEMCIEFAVSKQEKESELKLKRDENHKFEMLTTISQVKESTGDPETENTDECSAVEKTEAMSNNSTVKQNLISSNYMKGETKGVNLSDNPPQSNIRLEDYPGFVHNETLSNRKSSQEVLLEASLNSPSALHPTILTEIAEPLKSSNGLVSKKREYCVEESEEELAEKRPRIESLDSTSVASSSTHNLCDIDLSEISSGPEPNSDSAQGVSVNYEYENNNNYEYEKDSSDFSSNSQIPILSQSSKEDSHSTNTSDQSSKDSLNTSWLEDGSEEADAHNDESRHLKGNTPKKSEDVAMSSSYTYRHEESSPSLSEDCFDIADQRRKRKREKLHTAIVNELVNLNKEIRMALAKENPQNITKAVSALEDVEDLPINESVLKKCPAVLETLSKCQKYKESKQVRQISRDIYTKFKGIMTGSENKRPKY